MKLKKATLSCGIGLAVLAACGTAAHAQAPACAQQHCAFEDPGAPLESRVKDLVGRMTLEEKVSQMLGHAPAIPRLGVAEYDWWNEGLHGVARNGIATNFPQSTGLAATWDDSLIHSVADVVSTEARAKNDDALKKGEHRRHTGLTYWSPNINILRDPRWGRGMETFGEDPFLTGRMGVEFVRGLQGDDPRYLKLVATPKHFAVHSGPESLRHGFNVDVSPHDLEDTYLPAFRATVVEGHADSVMCAYSAVDGAPACASAMLLQQNLRDRWGFQGYVVSDCDAVADIARGHHDAPDNAHASALALKAGTDLNCGQAYKSLLDSVKAGLVDTATIDRAVERLFTARFRLGLFDPSDKVGYKRITIAENNTAAHRELALKAAQESMVLLKNDGTLPLKAAVRRIAVIGPAAATLSDLEGNYNGTAPNPVVPLLGIQKRFRGSATVDYAPGSIFVAGAGATIPTDALRSSGAGSEHGLKGEYFDHSDFSGSPRVVRVDKTIEFDWNRVSPAEGIPASAFAVRWSGEFVPPVAGDYVLSFRASAKSFHLFLDGKPLGDDKTPTHISFANTQPHSIRIEYKHAPDNSDVGLEWEPPSQALLEPALKLAQGADVIVACVGLSPNLEGEQMNVHTEGFDGGDRTAIELPEVQRELLEKLGATGKPLVVVLMSGSAVAMTWSADHANALLEAWYPGEAGGDAIAKTLAGDINPAGRLPMTFYRSTADLPAFTDYSMSNRTYRYFGGPVLYPFGFGLSYTHFRYSALKLSHRTLEAGSSLDAEVDVTNAGTREGDEVAELYLAPPQLAGAPRVELQGYARVHLRAGETRQVKFSLDERQLSIVQPDGARVVAPGHYTVTIGGGQPGYAANDVSKTFTISGQSRVLPH